jgi:Helix-turn-helix domain
MKNTSQESRISSAQLRAARALLRWSAVDLAQASRVSVATIRRVEVMEGDIPVTSANEAAIRRALEAAGVEFIDENGGGAGVRLRKPPKSKSGHGKHSDA